MTTATRKPLRLPAITGARSRQQAENAREIRRSAVRFLEYLRDEVMIPEVERRADTRRKVGLTADPEAEITEIHNHMDELIAIASKQTDAMWWQRNQQGWNCQAGTVLPIVELFSK